MLGNGFEGFQNLQSAINFEEKTEYQCRQPSCNGCVVETATTGHLIAIELDVKPSVTYAYSLSCRLSDFPTSLRFGKSYR